MAGAAKRALSILARLPTAQRARPFAVQLQVQALLEIKQPAVARKIAERHLLVYPEDQVVKRLLARVRSKRETFEGTQPLETLARATRFVRAGEHEAALRILRLLALDHPDEPRMKVAIRNVMRRMNTARTKEAIAMGDER